MTRVTFANVIRTVKCKACAHTWGIGCNVHKTGSTYCPKCRATVALGKWSGGSDRTIWSSPAVNYAYRAWHDSIHLRLAARFDAAGEYKVARASLYLARTARDRAILWAETWGQVEAFLERGRFPEDQRAFVRAYGGIR